MRILKFQDSYKAELVEVWEASVQATHNFLSQSDLIEIKKLVESIDFNAFPVYCSFEDDRLSGFIGVHELKVEMLFLHPDFFGKGIGKALMQFAFEEFNAKLVDVNEQNEQAVAFYKHLGFKIFHRSEKDDQGKDYPILRMKLVE